MKAIYKPFGILLGLAAGILGRQTFNWVWGKLDDREPPEPTTLEVSWPRLLFASAVQGVTYRLVRVAVDRIAAKGFYNLTGVWPGERRPERT
jgi:hypothetical protein